ncbi:MAG TPA: 5-carboxymethyl-2-hydroxymuconate semialdehyde dehydrogenase [Micrococcaceae bacterium]|nr:5-carboxymethyl-2-hydroxymuconate semialdehyde dehydrogenase [Micrococcaceae bacterium]
MSNVPENLPTHLQHYIDGKFVDSISGKTFDVQEPVKNENYATVASAQPEDVDLAVAAANKAFKEGPWSKMLPRERSRVLHKIADIVESRDEELALLESFDSGLPITQAKGQARRAAENFRFFADLIVAQVDNTFRVPGRQMNYVNRKPIGTAALITPWNVPFMQESWKLAPAIATGNSVVLKPASYTPLSAVLWPEIFREAGLPEGVFNLIFGSGGVAGDYLVKHPDVPLVSFTGDSSTGATISTAAAPQFKGLSLELGGKSPKIFFEDIAAKDDAFYDKAQEGFTLFALNQGEVCTCPSRALIQESIYDRFMGDVVARTKAIKQGHPLDTDTMMGAQASNDQLEKILSYMDIGKSEGAKVLLGGGRADLGGELSGGYYVQPTIFEGHNKMRIFQEEIFGPVVAVTKFKDYDDAISIANDTLYGLGSGVWSRNGNVAYRAGRAIQAGRVWVNQYHAYPAHSAFGGYKSSGIGRENHLMMLDHYQQTKNLLVSYSEDKLGFF